MIKKKVSEIEKLSLKLKLGLLCYFIIILFYTLKLEKLQKSEVRLYLKNKQLK